MVWVFNFIYLWSTLKFFLFIIVFITSTDIGLRFTIYFRHICCWILRTFVLVRKWFSISDQLFWIFYDFIFVFWWWIYPWFLWRAPISNITVLRWYWCRDWNRCWNGWCWNQIRIFRQLYCSWTGGLYSSWWRCLTTSSTWNIYSSIWSSLTLPTSLKKKMTFFLFRNRNWFLYSNLPLIIGRIINMWWIDSVHRWTGQIVTRPIVQRWWITYISSKRWKWKQNKTKQKINELLSIYRLDTWNWFESFSVAFFLLCLQSLD